MWLSTFNSDVELDPRIWNKKNKFPDSFNGVWITLWMSRLWDIQLDHLQFKGWDGDDRRQEDRRKGLEYLFLLSKGK